MRRAALVLAVAAAVGGGAWSVAAATLRVSPVLLDAESGQKAGVLTLSNLDDRPLTVQVRVFRWVQQDGEDRLVPTSDVVVSPPAAALPAGTQHLVRVVRIASAPPEGEEAYRILIDQLPDAVERPESGVAFVLRQSLPVFFHGPGQGGPDVAWRLARGPSGARLVADNHGARRLRISELELKDATGAVLEHKAGLIGYVLAGAEMSWPLAAPTAASARTLEAATEAGPIQVDLVGAGSP